MSKAVTIYTTSTCAFCQAAKEYFKQNNVEYKEVNVENDIEAQKEMVDKSHQMGVPVITVDDEVVVGFDKPRLDQLLLEA